MRGRMDSERLTRRRCLGLVGAALSVGAAGCSGLGGSSDTANAANGTSTVNGTSTATGNESEPDAGGTSAYTEVYREVIDSVVLVRVPNGGLGSGWMYDQNHVVTNHHVVTDADTVEIQFKQGTTVTGTVVGTDAYSDLAAIRVSNKPDSAQPLPLANSEPAIGTKVAAVGSPYGLRGSLTSGVVSAVDRLIPSPVQGQQYRIPNAIQTDAPVNPGNSGGPLVNLDGTVLGVVNSGGGENIAFAISYQLVRRVIPALIKDGTYRHPYLGISVADVTQAIARANGLDQAQGVLVTDVASGGPAAGKLRPADGRTTVNGSRVPTGGDVILAVNGQQVNSREALISYLAVNASPGETVTLTVLRNGNRQKIDVTLGARPTP